MTGTRGAKARGRLVFEGGAKPENLTSLRLIATPTDSDMMAARPSAFGMAAVKDTGTFEIDGLVGGRVFRFMDPPKGWFLKRITHDNDDVTDKGYDFKPGEEVEGFEIVMTTRSQTRVGHRHERQGRAGEGLHRRRVPRGPAAVDDDDTAARAGRPGPISRGSSDPALPPGAYLAIAVEYVAEGEWMDPEWLARAARKATSSPWTREPPRRST